MLQLFAERPSFVGFLCWKGEKNIKSVAAAFVYKGEMRIFVADLADFNVGFGFCGVSARCKRVERFIIHIFFIKQKYYGIRFD